MCFIHSIINLFIPQIHIYRETTICWTYKCKINIVLVQRKLKF